MPSANPDIERALLDPPSVFATPEAVLAHPALSPAQKIEILQRWEYDAADIAVAVEDGMPGAEEPLLRRTIGRRGGARPAVPGTSARPQPVVRPGRGPHRQPGRAGPGGGGVA